MNFDPITEADFQKTDFFQHTQTTMNTTMTMAFPPQVDPAEDMVLPKVLRGRGWMLGRNLIEETGITDRRLRAEAEASKGRIITGNKGYCLREECGLDERERSGLRLVSQGKKMVSRGELVLEDVLRERNP